MLRTRHREHLLLRACVEARQRCVVDNANPTRAERRVYIEAAGGAGFRVVGYDFRSRLDECLRRNQARPSPRRAPLEGLLGTAGRMELPVIAEGFDELHYLWIDEFGEFVVEEWRHQDR